MSRNDEYNNTFDEQDDGEDLEITDEDEAASDEQGRDEAALCLRTGRSIRGNGKYDEQHRRMWFRMAQKALAQAQERREEAEAETAAEKARAAAEEQAEREQIAREAKEQRHRERFERSMRESDERWERLNEQTREENAAWEAGREERERREREDAAAPRPAAPVRRPAIEARPVQRPPATMTTSNAPTARPTTQPGPASPSSPRSAGVPSHSGSAPPTQRPRQQSAPPAPPRPHRMEAERRVVTPPCAQPSPARAPAATAPPRRPLPTLPAPMMPRTPREAPPAFTSPATAVLSGADLAAWRSARGLTQRPAADLLGVAPSTVAKAELLPGKVLGDQLRVALAAALAR
jgi:hypothetical protein